MNCVSSSVNCVLVEVGHFISCFEVYNLFLGLEPLRHKEVLKEQWAHGQRRQDLAEGQGETARERKDKGVLQRAFPRAQWVWS